MFRPGFVDTLYIWAATLLSTAGQRLHWRCPVFYCSCIAILSHLLFHRYFIYCFFIALNTEAANLILSDLSSDNKEIHHFLNVEKTETQRNGLFISESNTGRELFATVHFDSVLVGLYSAFCVIIVRLLHTWIVCLKWYTRAELQAKLPKMDTSVYKRI